MAELNHRGVPSSAQGDRQQVWVMPPKPTLFTRVLKMQTTQSLGKLELPLTPDPQQIPKTPPLTVHPTH